VKRVDLYISNDRHHPAMLLPVARHLERAGWRTRLLSLCELRGLATPSLAEDETALESVVRVFPPGLRRSPSTGGGPVTGEGGRTRRLLRELVWRLLLAPRLARLLATPPAVAVVPNDAAFPYDRIVDLLRARDVRVVLVQEGIRFDLPAETERRYGAGGAAIIAAWGESSREYFLAVGADPSTIRLTGNPRLGPPLPRPEHRSPAPPVLLTVTNPVDDQGLCSPAQKVEMIRRLVAALEEELRGDGCRVVLKLHARESEGEYRTALGELGGLVRFETTRPLPELFAEASAVIVMASTVGLEALRAGLPLGALEIPGRGFVHDYVDCRVATPIHSTRVAADVRALLDRRGGGEAIERYLARTLADVADSGRLIAELIEETAP